MNTVLDTLQSLWAEVCVEPVCGEQYGKQQLLPTNVKDKVNYQIHLTLRAFMDEVQWALSTS